MGSASVSVLLLHMAHRLLNLCCVEFLVTLGRALGIFTPSFHDVLPFYRARRLPRRQRGRRRRPQATRKEDEV